jgi:hypothetical protein
VTALTASPLDNRFAFDVECDVFEKARPDGGTGRFIGGFVSTDHMDRQGEVLLQEGLDFAPFLEKGWFNDNHLKDTDALVGYPTSAELRDTPDGLHKGWYVEGELLEGDGTTRADRLWGLAQSLKKSGKRKLGFSVEGKITDRTPGQVRKAIVNEVAITRCPVNTRASMDVLAKSLSVGAGSGEGGASVPGEAIAGNAGPLQPEALERKRKKKKIKKSSAVNMLMLLHKGCSRQMAEQIVDYAHRYHNAA